MQEKIICDTGVISRYVTKHKTFKDIIEKITSIGEENVFICSVTRIELGNWLSGYVTIDKKERSKLMKDIKSFKILHVNEQISKMAIEISQKNINSKPVDTLIGATALYHKMKVLTINEKDFQINKIPII